MTEKNHGNINKKAPQHPQYPRNRGEEAPSHASDILNFTQMFKSLNISSDSQNIEAFEDQRLMSEIGKLFFTSMVKFSNILKSHNTPSEVNNTCENEFQNSTPNSKNQQKSRQNQAEKKGNREFKGEENKGAETNAQNQNRKQNKNRNKTMKQKSVNLNKTQKAETNNKNPRYEKNKVDKEKTINENQEYGLSTQCENEETNYVDFQTPTPNNESDEKQKLNLNIYRFINNCVSAKDCSTTDTYLTVREEETYFPTLEYSKNHKNKKKNEKVVKEDKVKVLSKALTEVQKRETDEDRLLMGCFGGDLDQVKRLKGCNLEFVDEVGRSAIHYACTSGNLELVKYLVSNKVDVNKKDIKGWTPLFIAIVKNHVDIVKLLLENEADLTVTLRHRCAPTRITDAHSNAIHFAAIKANKEITEMLINKKVDINQKDSQGITPLSYSCYRGDLEYVTYLLEKGANPTIQDVNGRSSFHSVALGGSLEVAKKLNEKGGVENIQDRWSLTPSKLAQIKGYTELSEYLKKEGSLKNAELDTSRVSVSSEGDESDEMYQLLSTTIASALNESNSDQIYRCLTRLGPDVVKTLFELTLKVEKNGGVTTADGKRPRTPGGVFFTLLKQMHLNNYITKEDYQYIRAEEKERLKSINHNNISNKTAAKPKDSQHINVKKGQNKSRNKNNKGTGKSSAYSRENVENKRVKQARAIV